MVGKVVMGGNCQCKGGRRLISLNFGSRTELAHMGGREGDTVGEVKREENNE